MKDISGIEIKAGDTVRTEQHKGGIFAPPRAKTGIAEEMNCSIYGKTLRIRYRKEGKDFDSYILLEGQINEIIKT